MITADDLSNKIHALKIGERLVLPKIPEAMYHGSPGVGSTLLKAGTSSMHHYKQTSEGVFKGTRDTRIGSATHALVLEPELFDEKFHQLKEGEQRRETLVKRVKEQDPYKEVINFPECEEADILAGEVISQCGDLFVNGEPELSYWFRHETGMILKARVDYQRDDFGLDLKTGKFADESAFVKTVKFDYAIQDQLYLMVTGLKEFAFIGVSKSDHHDCYRAIQGQGVRDRAKRIIDKTIREIAFAHEEDCFPRHEVKWQKTELTKWEKSNEEVAA
jgi:hypothetical protein